MKKTKCILFSTLIVLFGCEVKDVSLNILRIQLHITDDNGNNIVEGIPTQDELYGGKGIVYTGTFVHKSFYDWTVYVDNDMGNYSDTRRSQLQVTTKDGIEKLEVFTEADGMKEQYIIDYNITCSYLFGDEKPHIIRVKWVRLAGDYFCEEVFLDEVSMEVTEDVKFWPVAHLVVNR